MPSGFNKGFTKGSVAATHTGMNTCISKWKLNPASIQTLAGWWKPESGITLAGALVSAWENQGVLGGTLTQSATANQPFYNLSGSDSIYPAVACSGNHYMTSSLAASAWTFLHAYSSTTFVVARTNEPNPNNQYGIIGTSLKSAASLVPGINFFIDDRGGSGYNDRLGVQLKNNAGSIFDVFGTNGTAKTPTNYQVFEFHVVTGSGVSFLIDNTLTTAAASGSFTGAQYWGDPQFSLYIGLVPGTNYYRGNFLEILVYSGSLSTAERQLVRNYLDEKYNLPGL